MQKREHDRKIGGRCEYIEPNIKESCFLYDNDLGNLSKYESDNVISLKPDLQSINNSSKES